MTGTGKYVYAQPHVTVWDITGPDGRIYRKPTRAFLDIRKKQLFTFDPEKDFAHAFETQEAKETEETNSNSSSEEGSQDEEGLSPSQAS